MGHHRGRVIEVRFELSGQMEALISCPNEVIPQAGQYLLAVDPGDPSIALGTPLFLAQGAGQGFWAASPIPAAWRPGTELQLVGPSGHGFSLPGNILRLGLVALGETIARLMPLVRQSASSQYNVTLFTDLPLPPAPSLLEALPLNSLLDELDWPDFMIFDLPVERLAELRSLLNLPEGRGLPCPAQVLVTTPMPCAGAAQCGVCAVPSRRGWKLACEDGPVFDLRQLKW